MHLLIDLFPFVDVAPPVGELRLDFRIRQLQERTLPQKVIGSLQAQVGQSLIILAAQLAVDLQKARQQVARSSGVDLIDYLLQEDVIDLQVPRTKFLGKNFEPEAGLALGAGISREENRYRVSRQIPRKSEQREPLLLRSRQGKAAE